MSTNGFLPNSTGVGATVLSDADYAASPALAQGAQIGELPPEYYNKVNRQATVIAAMIGQFIVDKANVDAKDSQSIAMLETNFIAALNSVFTGLATSVATTVYLTRPGQVIRWLDPVNGSDTNDGSRPSLARKSIDALIEGMGPNATEVRLLGDPTFTASHGSYASLTLVGAAAVGDDPNAYTPMVRNVAFAGTASNSPIGSVSTCAGLWMFGPGVRCVNLNLIVPDMPGGQNIRKALCAFTGQTVVFDNCTVSAAGSSGYLLGISIGALTVRAGSPFTNGATGRLFEGVAAGGNPNNFSGYSTNITSA